MTTKARGLLILVVVETLAILAIVAALLARQPPQAMSPRNSIAKGTGGSTADGEPGPTVEGHERTGINPRAREFPGVASEPPPPAGTPALRMLAGVVTDPEGEPLSGVSVQVKNAPGSGDWSARSDEHGRYAVTGVPAGRWSVLGFKAGFHPLSAAIDVPDEPPCCRRDFVLDPAVVLELFFRTADGRSVNAALAAMEGDDPQSATIAAVATSDKPKGHLSGIAHGTYYGFGCGIWLGLRPWAGRGDLEALRSRGVDGLLQVNGDLPVWVSAVLRHRVLASQRVDPGQGAVTFTLGMEEVARHLASARLRVVAAESGQPITTVRAAIADMGGGKLPDASGVVTFERMRPGIMFLQVGGQDREQVRCRVLLEPGIMNDLGTFELAEATSISGTVVDPEGTPCRASLMWVSLDRTAALPQSLDMRISTGADSEGRFQIGSLGRGRYLLTATHEGCALCTKVVPTWGGSVEGVRMELQRAPVSVLDARVPAGRVWLLRLLDENGVPRWARNALSARPIPLRLPAGSYTLEVYDEGELIRSLPLAVKGEAVEIIVEP